MRTNLNVSVVMLAAMAMGLQACGLPFLAGNGPTQAPIAPTQPPAQPAIVHSLVPNAGNVQVSNAHDNEESTTFDEKSVRGGDEFINNHFERPFTAHDMAYLPYIDIVDAAMTKDDNFYYVQIKLAGVDSASGGVKGYYGAEFDLDKDGRTEFLILGKAPGRTKPIPGMVMKPRYSILEMVMIQIWSGYDL